MFDAPKRPGLLATTACCSTLLAAAFTAATLSWAAAGDNDKPASQAGAAEQDYAAELPRIPLKDPAEVAQGVRSPARVPRRAGRRRAAVAQPGRDRLRRGRPALRRRVPRVQPVRRRSEARTARAASACWRTPTATASTTRAPSFAADVPMATAVACWDGGVYVGSAPDLLYLKDTDGDGKADVRRVVFTGFGTDRAGEGMLNSFRWGLDNRFHISTSLDGGDVRRADRPEAKAVSVRGHGFLLDPRGETFELTGGGGQHGMSMDDWGRTYVCGNSDPFHLVMYDSRYLARNPYLQAPPAAVNVAPAGKFTKLLPRQPGRAVAGAADAAAEPGDRPRLRRGGLAVGLLHRRHRRDGLPRRRLPGRVPRQPVRRRRGQQPRPSRPARADGLAGDGRERRGRPRVPRLARQRLPPGADGQRAGRLPLGHRHVPRADRGGRLPAAADPQAHGRRQRRRSRPDLADRARRVTRRSDARLGKATTAELVALLEHPNGWHRDTASRLLYQRQDRSAVAPLRQLAAGSKRPVGRAHALYALAGLGALEPDVVLAALSDPEPRVREHALRLAEPFGKDEPRIQQRMAAMVGDPDPLVRYQLAFSLGALPGTTPAAALAALAVRDGADPWMRVAILSSVSGCAGEVFHAAGRRRRLPRLGARPHVPDGAGGADRRRRTDRATWPRVLKALDGPLAGESGPGPRHRLGHDEPSIGRGAGQADWSRARTGRVRSSTGSWPTPARPRVDEKKPAAARAAAVRSLAIRRVRRRAGAAGRVCWPPRQPPDVQTAAIETLARFDDARVADDPAPEHGRR